MNFNVLSMNINGALENTVDITTLFIKCSIIYRPTWSILSSKYSNLINHITDHIHIHDFQVQRYYLKYFPQNDPSLLTHLHTNSSSHF